MNYKKFPEFTVNGKEFPLWILKNFSKYKLDPIIKNDNEDPCKIIEKKIDYVELKKYQQFVGAYLDFRSPYRDILLYHGLGSGKTASAINIYNMLYNYNPRWNVFILIKASLKDDPWLKDLNKFILNKDKDNRMSNIIFIHYDSPTAEKQFIDAVKSADITKKNLYIFDEAHNFIKNVYNNLTEKKGKRALTIYDYIQKEKLNNNSSRVVLMSGTPAVNNPFELALIFNLLRPNIFPMIETEFNDLYIKVTKTADLNSETKNMFQRRILGLVSYYRGSTSDLFAKQNLFIKKLYMDEHHQDVYDYYEAIEDALDKKRMGNKQAISSYRSYTRQASNFVFPNINKEIMGENRPRPNKFKLSENDANKYLEGRENKLIKNKNENDLNKFKVNLLLYTDTIKKFILTFDKYLSNWEKEDIINKHTLDDDIKIFKEKYKFKFNEFWINHTNKSNLLKYLYMCSCKMTASIFYMMRSKGPILFYSNYVKIEGLEIFKIYLKYFGFNDYNDETNQGKDHFRYTEFHGDIDRDTRKQNLKVYNDINNIYGKLIKIILISPAGSEGISLLNVRQVHILEPYWNEVRIEQLIGRAIRQCSHKDLDMNERYVDVFRYMATRKYTLNNDKLTTDEDIYESAKRKKNLINNFLQTIKEVAIDCELFKNHNMYDEKYPCFKFNQASYFEKNIGPSYKEDIYYDKKLNDGLNSNNSIIKKIKVLHIKAVTKIDNEYSEVKDYWYYPDNGIVYDYELDYPVGKIYNIDNIPSKLDKDTYIIDDLIDIESVKIL